MDIIVIRHGMALGPDKTDALGLSDDERPLTLDGERQMRAAAAGLRTTLDGRTIDDMLTSPLLRARQSADIITGYLDDPRLEESEVLAPQAEPEVLDTALRPYFGDQRLLLVGHEPGLAAWVSWSLTRRHDRLLAFDTAGAAMLAFPGAPEGGTGTLRWLLTSDQLRAQG